MSPVSEKFEDESGNDSPPRALFYQEESRVHIFDKSPTNTAYETTILYSLIKSKKWESVIERCRGSDKKEAGFWVLQNDGNFEWKSLPIHLVSTEDFCDCYVESSMISIFIFYSLQ